MPGGRARLAQSLSTHPARRRKPPSRGAPGGAHHRSPGESAAARIAPGVLTMFGSSIRRRRRREFGRWIARVSGGGRASGRFAFLFVAKMTLSTVGDTVRIVTGKRSAMHSSNGFQQISHLRWREIWGLKPALQLGDSESPGVRRVGWARTSHQPAARVARRSGRIASKRSGRRAW